MKEAERASTFLWQYDLKVSSRQERCVGQDGMICEYPLSRANERTND